LLGKKHFPKIENTKKLAEIFNKSRRSIQREIKRGLVEHLTTNLDLRLEYNADYAQKNTDYEKTAKGAPMRHIIFDGTETMCL
jgi:IS30 family transposase